MKNVMILWLCLSTMTLQVLSQSTADAGRIQALDRTFANAIQQFNVPGMSIAIVKDNTVIHAKGYGVRNEDYVQQVPLEAFGGQIPQVGMQFQAGNDEGRYIVTITAIEGDLVTVDANHPLAGVELHFAVEVMEVREATADEISHGHVHGPGGAHHE
jgi:FKBP-type peptidyl-prolyl cis-trans isomerase 2